MTILFIFLAISFISTIIAIAIVRTAPKENIPHDEDDINEYFDRRRYFEEQL